MHAFWNFRCICSELFLHNIYCNFSAEIQVLNPKIHILQKSSIWDMYIFCISNVYISLFTEFNFVKFSHILRTIRLLFFHIFHILFINIQMYHLTVLGKWLPLKLDNNTSANQFRNKKVANLSSEDNCGNKLENNATFNPLRLPEITLWIN